MMTSSHNQNPMRPCAICERPVSPGAPEGLCIRCLLDAGLADSAETESDDHVPAASNSAAPAPRYFGDYELLREAGRGGMGVVYEARQFGTQRVVALKLLASGALATRDAVHRFHTEAQAAARLEHPHIVPIHETGVHDGQYFLTMRFLTGGTLAQSVAARPFTPRRAAEVVRTVASAVHHAHQHGVLHRDLKPGNILLDAAGEPHVADFGLARLAELDTRVTLPSSVLGTAAYMAPEQAAGGTDAVTTAADIYGLGAVLYELLAGRPPFTGRDVLETLRAVQGDDPIRPGKLSSAVPVDLETICLKCLEKEPSRRYQSAQELADELDRFLKHEPIHARPIGPTARLWRWCRRKPVVASLTASSALLLLAVAIGAPIAAFRINQERLLTRQSLYAADMRLASQAVHEGAFNHAGELLIKYLPGRGGVDLRGFEWRYLAQAVQSSEPFRMFEGLPAPSVWKRTFLARSERFLYNQSLDELRAWDMTTWEPVPIVPPPQPASVRWQYDPSRGSAYAVDQAQHSLAVYTLPKFESGPTLRLPGSISLVAMSQDRHALAVGFQEGASHRVLVWDLGHDARIGELGNFEAAISALTFSRDRTLLAASSTNGVVGIWDLKTLRPLPAPPSSAGNRWRLEFTPDNKRLLSENANPSVWDIGARQAFTVERAGQGNLHVFDFSPDDKYIVVSWYDGFDLTLLDSRTLLMKGTLRGHRALIGGIGFSPDGKLLASASVDQTARIWDLATQTEVGIVGGFGEAISDVEFTADGQNIVLIGGFGQIRIYKLSTVLQRGLFAKIPGWEGKGFAHLALSPDERRLATIGVEGTLALWDRQSRSVIRSASFPRYQLSNPRLAFSPNGERLAWVTGDALRIMRVESGEISATAIDGNHDANSIAFSPDGHELAFGCGKELLIHELVSGRQQRFAATDDEVFAVNYSPDGTRIVFGDRRGTVTLCERANGRVLSKVKAHPPAVGDVEMSPDGRLLATCGADGSIKLWRVQSDGLQEPATTLHGQMGYVTSVAFSPDGTRLVSASGDQTLKIWDPHRAAELATLYGHHLYVFPAEFAKDGRTIYSAGFDGEIHFWEAPPLTKIDLSTTSTPIQSRPLRRNKLK